MEATCSSEMSLDFRRTTQRVMSENSLNVNISVHMVAVVIFILFKDEHVCCAGHAVA
jgi:hypothetical protein